MKLAHTLRRERLATTLQVAGEHPRRQQHHPLAVGGSHIQIRVAENQQTPGALSRQTLDMLALRVGLLQPANADPVDEDPAAVALRLDAEKAARADRHMVDVAAARVHIVQGEPALPGHPVESAPTRSSPALPRARRASATLDAAVHEQHPDDHHHGEGNEQNAVPAKHHEQQPAGARRRS